jgi:hypothetical protein
MLSMLPVSLLFLRFSKPLTLQRLFNSRCVSAISKHY